MLVYRLMKLMVYFLSPPEIEGPVDIGMSLDIASIDAISEINMVHISQRKTNSFTDGKQWVNKNSSHWYFRTTRPPSSSVRGGGTPGWCSQVTRALAWTDVSCHSSGSLTPSFPTPSAPSCMTSQWKIVSYASSAMALFSMPSGT